MKSFSRREIVGLLGLGVLATLGCAESNEADAERARKSAGNPGAPNPDSKVDNTPAPVPKTQEEYGKLQKNPFQGAGYPGAKAQKK